MHRCSLKILWVGISNSCVAFYEWRINKNQFQWPFHSYHRSDLWFIRVDFKNYLFFLFQLIESEICSQVFEHWMALIAIYHWLQPFLFVAVCILPIFVPFFCEIMMIVHGKEIIYYVAWFLCLCNGELLSRYNGWTPCEFRSIYFNKFCFIIYKSNGIFVGIF